MPPLQQTEAQRQAAFAAAGQQPAAQAPVTPAPSIPTPAAPGISSPAAFASNTQQPAPPPVQVNVNNGQPQQPAQTTTGAPTAGPQAPGNGSVMDILSPLGLDASAFGIQGYTGTAAQNQQIAEKYKGAFEKNKGTKVPDTGAQAVSALDKYFQEDTPAEENPQAAFFDAYSGMNPVVKTLYDTINKELSSVGTKQSFTEQYQQLVAAQGIPGLQTDLLNMERIMDGTEDDIREEITKVGGFATESQVQALKGARNKTLLKQANFLQGQLQMRNDYVKQIMELTQADRAQVERDVDRKLGLTTKLFELSEKMTEGAKENYQSIVDKVGYQGLADAFKDDPSGKKLAEKTLGLPPGALSNSAFLTPPKATSTVGSIQEYEYAKAQGYKGTFTQYQNEDANRKRSIAAAGVAGLSQSQVNSTVNQIAGNLDNEPIVKAYNTVQEGYQTIKSIGVNTTSPADDIGFIYAFAKIQDPNSVVREGEYNTIQKYAQTWADNFGFKAQRIYSNTNFLSPDAKQKMLNTLKPKVDTITNQYNQVRKEYQRQIDDAYAGKQRQVTNYTTASPADSPKTGTLPDGTRVTMKADGTIVDDKGNKYDSEGKKIK